jgi:transketolase
LTENGHGLDELTKDAVTGKNIVVREGKDITIVALGPSLRTAISVSNILSKNGFSAEVIYVHSFKPFDTSSILKSVSKTGTLATISQLSTVGGLGSLCAEAISGKVIFNHINFEVGKFIRGYGELDDLLERADQTPQQISSRLLTTLREVNS